MSPTGGHLGLSFSPKSNNTWLAALTSLTEIKRKNVQITNNIKYFFILSIKQSVVTFVTIGYPTWLPGAIKASDWLKFLMIFFSDTTWRMELKIVMNDHCKLLTKCCYFLDRLKSKMATSGGHKLT
jgi:hypothetical protein